MNGSNEHSTYERAAVAMLGEVLLGCVGAVVLVVLGLLTADWWTGLDVMSQVVALVTK